VVTLGFVLVGVVLEAGALVEVVPPGLALVGVLGVAAAVVCAVATEDALKGDPLEELPQAPSPRQASEARSSAIVVGPGLLVLMRGMVLLRGSSACRRIIQSATAILAVAAHGRRTRAFPLAGLRAECLRLLRCGPWRVSGKSPDRFVRL
jgi:hypothetical protein